MTLLPGSLAPRHDLAVTGRAALVVAHPGHELRLHHWIERHRPLVCVLTLGDGADRSSRLPSTTRVLEAAGAELGPVYGRWRDRDLYEMLMKGRHDDCLAVADILAGTLMSAGVTCIVADAEERYNPSHDLCRYLVESAVQRCALLGHVIQDFEFPLVAAPDALLRATASPAGSVCLRLDEPALDRKLAAAAGYAEMAGEVANALARWGRQAFATECLSPARVSPLSPSGVPYYEEYGARQVAAGQYPDVLRYHDHVRPLRESLATWASDTGWHPVAT